MAEQRHMKICMVAEGNYPNVVGGVASWVHSMIRSFPNAEFMVLSIISNREQSGKFSYELPANVSAVYEVYLEDGDWCPPNTKRKNFRLTKKEFKALRSLVIGEDVDWETLFHFFSERKFSLNDLLMGEDFLKATQDCYNKQYSGAIFSDFLWTLRSMYLPLFLCMMSELPKADLYHCVATGYSGVLGSMAKCLYGCSLLVSEHGIYSREREEQLIKAKWVQGVYKNIWIDQFKKMSMVAYNMADKVTSLFEHARELQVELGCPAEKTVVTPNGISIEGYDKMPPKTEEDKQYVNIGAVLRVTPIKDVKTMIRAYAFAKEKSPHLKLWLMGPTDEDAQYAQECFDMVDIMQVKDVVFTGRVNVKDYYGRMDLTILTSVSEGQPLTILEGYAAHLPCIATDVGNCSGLLFGEGDNFGPAGILCHIMNVDEIAQAMIEMAVNPEKRHEMGENGYKRVMSKYLVSHMKATYTELYSAFAKAQGIEWLEDEIVIELDPAAVAEEKRNQEIRNKDAERVAKWRAKQEKRKFLQEEKHEEKVALQQVKREEQQKRIAEALNKKDG